MHLDQAIIELRTGTAPQTPLEWPFTQETNDEQFTDIRLSRSLYARPVSSDVDRYRAGYIRGLRTLLVLAL